MVKRVRLLLQSSVHEVTQNTWTLPPIWNKAHAKAHRHIFRIGIVVDVVTENLTRFA